MNLINNNLYSYNKRKIKNFVMESYYVLKLCTMIVIHNQTGKFPVGIKFAALLPSRAWSYSALQQQILHKFTQLITHM